MSVFGLGRAITLYGGLERVAIRPVHLRPEARRDRPTIGKICSRPDGKLHRFGRGPCIVSKCYFNGYERRVRAVRIASPLWAPLFRLARQWRSSGTASVEADSAKLKAGVGSANPDPQQPRG
jgi:hypothetical protein